MDSNTVFDYDDSQLTFSDFSFNFAESLADDFISDAFDMAASVFVDTYWSDMFLTRL
ncbi:hypothetical protein [Paraglaciecola sp. L3A3]|uniref:hypothetical protein n=1 Tax=Paraglaciecola sp. L3A3 TaxID=2686358 RepID=UPI00131CD277|nr:hypothetical protein [Paraglaciecola sp. L3A3]